MDIDSALDQLADDCGKAFGFALAAALLERRDLQTPLGLKQFAASLHQLHGDERFSPQVGFVVGGIVQGICARLNAAKTIADPDPLSSPELC